MNRYRTGPYLLLATIAGGFSLLQFPLSAQELPPWPPKSQHGSVSQQIAGTRVTVEYNRPVARGRDLFGALVPWGRIWHPGADSATNFTFSTDVKVNGQNLAAGTYTIWTEPQPERWTFIFSRAHNVWHIPYPVGQDALRVQSASRTGTHMETLAFYFPLVEGNHAELVFHWGTVVVPLQLDVP